MLGAIAAMSVAVWFYYSAQRSGKGAISWAVSGVVVYFLAALLWTLLITPSLKESAMHNQSAVLIFMVRYAYIVIGVVSSLGLNHLLNKPGQVD